MAAESVELGTIYLVDLVGSTRLATSVGPVRWDEMREQFFGLLREAIEAFGGREFKNTGDGLMVAFASASAAVGCAVLTQQLFERRYRGAEQRLRVRIGLGTGESTVKDGEYFGMPATEAARLCDKAPADGILISPATRLLARRIDGARFESFGELELKGIPEPVEAFSVLWEPLDPERPTEMGRWPLPEALRTVPRVAFIGRETERRLLEVARTAARSGSRQVVLLSGEPGIGKTRLASYAALGANADGFAVCWGACSEDLAAAYEPWIAVCSQLVEHAADDVLVDYVQRSDGDAGRLARNLARRVPGAPAPQSSDPETERLLLFSAVAELLRVVGGSVPLCVVLDDFHWADGQSVALLKHVARSIERGALQIVVTYRDSDLTKAHPLTAVLADLRRLDGVERIALTGLGAEEVAELLAAAAGHDLDADGLALAGELATETGGNPFFIAEMLRSLIESGAITFDENTRRWNVDLAAVKSLPDSVLQVIEHRIDRLGDDAREALTVAAVIGRSFDVRLLNELVEMPESRLLDQLEAAVDATLLRESTDQIGRFAFEHALINHTLYQALGATRRARLHHRIALALETVYGPDSDDHLADLATHWRLATVAVDTTKAASYSIRAGRRALDSLAPSDAVKLFGDALDMLGAQETVDRCEALIGLGEAQRQAGDAAYRETLLEASRIASNLEDAELAARSASANNRGLYSAVGQVDSERLAAIERALELDQPTDPARRARLLALQALELTWDPDLTRRRTLVEEAVALARGAGDKRVLAEALQSAYYALWSAQTVELRSAFAEELGRCAEELRDPALRRQALRLELPVRVEQGELARAQDVLKRAQGMAAELGEQPYMKWVDAFQTAGLRLLRGDLAAGERLAERALQLGQEAGQPDALLFYGAQMFLLRLFQGRGEEIIALLEQSVQANPAVPALRAGLASTLCWLDRRAEATVILEKAASDRFEHVRPASDELTALVLYADAAAQTSDRPGARILYGLIQPTADRLAWNGISGYGHARLYLGLLAEVLGEHEQADKHLAFACEFHETNDMPLWTARGHLGWAEALAGRGDPSGAQEHATRALELAQQHGYGAFKRRAAALAGTESPAET